MKNSNNLEIERKFIVSKDALKNEFNNTYSIKSGYTSRETSSRVNYLSYSGFEKGFVTFKGKGSLSRKEFEYEIPASEAEFMVKDPSICPFTIDKTRHELLLGGKIWEIDKYTTPIKCWDVFVYPIIAEVELNSENEELILPSWVLLEVTEISAFKNHKMAINKDLPEEYYKYFKEA